MKTITLSDLKNTSYTLDVVEDILKEDPKAKVALDLDGIDGVDAYVFCVISNVLTHERINEFLDKHVASDLLHSDYCPMPCMLEDFEELLGDDDCYELVR